jgi:uncharacterized protein involved in exopolysaccharide biosynthesis
MNDYDFHVSDQGNSSFSVKDFLAVAFRHKRIAGLCFFGILAGAILAAVLQPPEYRATTKFLVSKERVDPTVSSEQNSPVTINSEVSEEQLNSEVELLRSPDILHDVAISCGLDKRPSLWDSVFGSSKPEKRVAKAVVRLQDNLKVEVVKKSNLIGVSYTSTDPQMAAKVLNALADAYTEKHVAVHRPPGQLEFFTAETDRYQKNLSDAEAQLKDLSRQADGVAPTTSRDIVLGKLNEFRASLQTTRADIASAEQRIKTLEEQAGTTPQRLTTQKKQTDDANTLESLKATLMSLELKRTELLTKYNPDYPLVKEVDQEVADTKNAITAEEAKPINEETTDRNPTYAWINEELAKAKADYTALQAKAAATETIVERYEAEARDLAQKGIVEQDLQRAVKADEETYLLFLRKREQARMSEALDRTRILNVAIAERPVVPSLPSSSPWLTLLAGTFLAGIVSIGTVWTKERLDPSFRTPTEVAADLKIPVLAAVPYRMNGSHGNGRNGNGNGNGNGVAKNHERSDSASYMVGPDSGQTPE